MDYALSPRMVIGSLTQHDSSTHELTTSVGFNLIYRPGSDLDVGYNDRRQTGLPTGTFAARSRRFVIKFSCLLAR